MSRQAFLYQAKCERRSSMPAFTFMLEIAVFVGFGVVVVSDPDFSVVVRIVEHYHRAVFWRGFDCLPCVHFMSFVFGLC